METIGLWLTSSGKEAVRIRKHTTPGGRVTYSWIGAFGAGSGQPLADYMAMVQGFQARKRGMRTILEPHPVQE